MEVLRLWVGGSAADGPAASSESDDVGLGAFSASIGSPLVIGASSVVVFVVASSESAGEVSSAKRESSRHVNLK